MPDGVSTGTVAFADPARLELATNGLISGQPVVELSRALQCSPMSIRALRDRLVTEGKIGQLKERLARKLEHIAETGAEIYLQALDAGEVKPRDIVLSVCQATDKALLLRGEATARLEVRAGEPTIESVNRKLKELLDSLPELEVIEVKALADEKAGGGGATVEKERIG